MEENFEKKHSKTFLKVLIPIILILLIAGCAAFFLFNKLSTKPVHVFKNVVEKAFNKIEVKEDAKTARAKIELTANVDSSDVNIKAAKQYIEAAKITLNEEVNLNKKIMKLNALIDYDNDNLIDANLILQNGKIYAFAKDFFSKYVEIDSEDMDTEELMQVFEEAFKTSNKVSQKETNKLLKDIENEILKFLDEQEYETSKEEIEIDGNTIKATKSTLKLNEKQVAKLMIKILTVIKDSEYVKSFITTGEIDFEEEIEDAIENLKDVDTTDTTMKISLYTTGVAGEIVKAEMSVKEYDEVMATVTYEVKDKENVVITAKSDDTTIKLKINQKDKNTTVYNLILPEELNGMALQVEHTKESKNNGKIVFTVKVPEEILENYNVKGDVTLKLNIKYELNYNVNVEETNISNSIKIDGFTEADQQELLTNIQNSKLYKLIEPFMGTITDTYDTYNTIDTYTPYETYDLFN